MKNLLYLLLTLALFPLTVSGEDSDLQQDLSLLRFRLFRAGEMTPVEYEVFLLGEEYFLYRNEDQPIRIDPETAEELVRIMEDYDTGSWNGFDESDDCVLDGESFDFSAAFTNGMTIRAEGNNAFPDHYFQAAGEMERLLASAEGDEAEWDIFGTYVYEGKGSGGNFTVTVNEDGTYSFSEGPLSSYPGGGDWLQNKCVLYFIEENGMDMINHFAAGNSLLVFIDTDSDNFPSVRLSDGAKFIKQ